MRLVNWRFCLVPAGGAIAAACFFLPWGRFSFLVVRREASGYTVGGSAWAIFAVSVILVAGGVILARPRRPAWMRSVIFGAALLGLLLFVMKANELAHGIWTPFGRLQPQDVGVKPGIGARGTIVGFFLAIAGSLLVPEPWPRWMPLWRALAGRAKSVDSASAGPASVGPVSAGPASVEPLPSGAAPAAVSPVCPPLRDGLPTVGQPGGRADPGSMGVV